jgi:hypothetical protein
MGFGLEEARLQLQLLRNHVFHSMPPRQSVVFWFLAELHSSVPFSSSPNSPLTSVSALILSDLLYSTVGRTRSHVFYAPAAGVFVAAGTSLALVSHLRGNVCYVCVVA